jgi:predicted alpha/beta superfamily hydrolase
VTGARRWLDYRSTRATAGSTVVGDLRVLPRLRNPFGGPPRDILVHLPAAALESGRRYPVVYLHDGQNLFDAATSFSGEWRVDETLLELAAEGLELIAVGIPNRGERRFAELTPYRGRPRGEPWGRPTGGLGLDYLRYLVEVVKPAVDASLPTRHERAATGILGSSLGGLISLSAAVRHPATFGLVGSMSTAIPPGQEPILARLRRLRVLPDRLYLDAGSGEGSFAPTPAAAERWAARMVWNLERTRAALVEAGLREPGRLRVVVAPGAIHHESAWAPRLPDALRFLFGEPSTGQ